MYVHRYYGIIENLEFVNLNAFYEGYNLYKVRINEWDQDVALGFLYAGSQGEEELLQRSLFFYKKLSAKSLLEMWLYVACFLTFINLYYFLALFSRTFHQLCYGSDFVKFWMVTLGALFFSCWFFFDFIWTIYNCLPYHILFYIFWIYTYLYPSWLVSLSDVYEFNEDELLKWTIDDYETLFDYVAPFDDWEDQDPLGLDNLPDPYSTDVKDVLQDLYQEKERKEMDTREGGVTHDAYYGGLFKYESHKGPWVNLKENFARLFKLISVILSPYEDNTSSNLHEISERFLDEGWVSDKIESEYDVLTGEYEEYIVTKLSLYIRVVMPSWNSMNSKVSVNNLYWVSSDVPSFIRLFYKIYWFFHEYLILKKIVEEHNTGKKKYFEDCYVILNFWENFKSFFGYRERSGVFKHGFVLYDDGYLLKEDPFDPEEVEEAEESIHTPFYYIRNTDKNFDSDLYNLFYEYENVTNPLKKRSQLDKLKMFLLFIKKFVLNLFGSINFWVSVLLFWKKTSPTRLFFYWIFVNVIWEYFILFILNLPYRYLKLLYFLKNCIFLFFHFFYSINILYWSFLLYSLSFLSFFYRILFKKVKPVGPFNYFNPSPWRQYKVEDFWKNFSFLFRRRSILPVRKYKLEGSFLIWSKERKKKK